MATPPDPDFRARVLGALDLSTDDMQTLHSVLAVQRACDREEASGPVYSSAALTRSSGNYPRRVSLPPTLEQAMESAAEWGDRVVVMLDIAGHRHRHACTITQSPTDRAVFCLRPEVNVQWSDAPHLPATFAEVAAWGREHLPRVLSCEALESGQVVQQAMVRAVDSGMEVELTIEVGDRTVQHRCRVEREHPADKYVFGIRPALETRFESISLVHTGPRPGGANRVTGCVPVHVAIGRVVSGLALLPAPPDEVPAEPPRIMGSEVEPSTLGNLDAIAANPALVLSMMGENTKLKLDLEDLRKRDSFDLPLPPAYRGADFYVVEAVDDGWVMEAGHENEDGPFGKKYVAQGEPRDTKVEAVVDAWALANSILRTDLETTQRDLAATQADLAGTRSSLDQALNSGDGTYRP